ncbi:MAG TPA: DNRLRE domain-containing protein [Planctomycetota bacterium]|jgi:hypothetical protein|nr:dockerin type I repeat-containing protein [Planctomycetota bacterium]OQC18947.1 MAG: hypothetical protein BWX69_03129 [Planctomycetes bacterium ADurb.Bin069]HNU24603.1 DNRLRE domain-containing protein [Planctomycetota bacterium]HOE29005.1 DNRLRE domain-containing protein [Planctomycetota bacterium]HOE85927.1 DNRLRE domain-containing protein [Planctomycetota bacterium]
MARILAFLLTLAAMAGVASGAVPPVADLTCVIGDGVAYLEWTNGGAYDGVRVLIDGTAGPGSPVAGSAESYRSDNSWLSFQSGSGVKDPRTGWFRVAPGAHTFTVTPYVGAENAPAATCAAVAPAAAANPACSINADASVTVTWTAGAYEAVEILRNGAVIAALEGSADGYTDLDPGWVPGYDIKEYGIRGINAAGSYATAACFAAQLSDGYLAFQEGVINGESTEPADLVNVVGDASTGMFVGYGQNLRNWNNGGGFYMEEGDLAGVGHGDLKDIFLKVDTAAIPAGTIVVGAELAVWYLYMRDVAPGGTAPQPHTLYARATLKEWNEGTVLSDAFGWGYQNGGPSNPGGVTFNSARHGQLLWEIPNAYGDSDVAPPTAQATTMFDPTVYFAWVRFNVTDLVQACADGGTTLALKITQNGTYAPPNPNFDYVPGLYGFATSQYGELTKHPKLVVRTLQAPANVAAQAQGHGYAVKVTWTNVGAAYDSIAILRNGATIASGLSAAAESYDDAVPAAGAYTYEVVAVAGGKEAGAAADPIQVDVPTVAAPGNLQCATEPDGAVMLTWNPGAAWDAVEVYGPADPATPLATLTGAAVAFTDADPGWTDGFERKTYGVRAAEIHGGEHIWSDTVYCTALNLGESCYAFQDGVVNGRVFDPAADVVADAHILVYGGGDNNTGKDPQFEQGSLWAGFAENEPWGDRGDQKDILMRIDVSAIPAGAVVVDAKLSILYFLLRDIAFPNDSRPIPRGPGPYNPPAHDLYIREALRVWNEGAGVDAPTPNFMNGRLALTGEVTWNAARHGEEDWELPGACGDSDVGPVAAATTFAPQTFPNPYCAAVPCVTRDPVGAWVDFDVIDLVQAWVDDPAGNLGFKITQNGASGPDAPLFEYVAGIYNFASSEFPETAKRPVLVVKVLVPPADLVCTPIAGTWSAALAWTNDPLMPYENIRVYRDGDLVDTLAGDATAYVDAAPLPGRHVYEVCGVYNGNNSGAATCEVEFTFVPPVSITACAIETGQVAGLAWTNGSAAYSGITVSVDGVDSTLAGDAVAFSSAPLSPGTHVFTITPFITVDAATYTAEAKTCGVLAPVPAPTALACELTSPDAWTVNLQWQNGWAYDNVVIARNGAVVRTLSGTAVSYTDDLPAPGGYTYAVSGVFGGRTSEPAECAVQASYVPPVTLAGCVFNADLTVSLAWQNHADYDAIVVHIDGEPTPLPGTHTAFVTPALAPGAHTIAVTAAVGAFSSAPVACEGNLPLPAPTALTCTAAGGVWKVQLAWQNGYAYENVMILRGGTAIDTLSGAPSAYTDTVPGPGTYEYTVYGFFGSLTQSSPPCMVQLGVPPVAITQCVIGADRIARLAWDLGADTYTSIAVVIDGTAVTPSLGGDARSYASTALNPGAHSFQVIPSIGAHAAAAAACSAQAPLPPIAELVCTHQPDSWIIKCEWVNGWTYTSIQVSRNGEPLLLLPGAKTAFTDVVDGPGIYQYSFHGLHGGLSSVETSCTVGIGFVPPVTFTAATVDENRRAHLVWTNATAYDGITILLDGTALSPDLPGTATSFDTEPLAPGGHTFAVRPFIGDQQAADAERTVVVPLPPPADVACVPGDDAWTVNLAWTSGWAYDQVVITRDGSEIATLLGAPTTYVDTVDGPGSYVYRVSGGLGALTAEAGPCTAEIEYVPAVAIVACTAGDGGAAHVTWTAEVVYESIRILIDGETVATLGGAATSYDSGALATGSHVIAVVPAIGAYEAAPASCTVEVTETGTRFRRGDSNTDGKIDVADPVRTLAYIFSHGTLNCLDAADANDDGSIDIADPIYTLAYLYSNGPAPRSPFPGCGLDPTEDQLDCASYPAQCPAP